MTQLKKKKIVQVDMDGVLCDWQAAYDRMRGLYPYVHYPQSIPGFYRGLAPIPGAIFAMKTLQEHYDVRILSAPSNKNPLSYTEKRLWIEDHLGYDFVEGITLTSYKGDVAGDYLIDDKSDSHGQDKFKGELIHFGTELFPHWGLVLLYLLKGV